MKGKHIFNTSPRNEPREGEKSQLYKPEFQLSRSEQKMTSTVLVNGATGNIGVAAIIGALRSKQKVLAIVRNQSSANKLFENVGTHDGITTVEADITSETGVQSVVDQVRAGKLPAFQHVYSCGK